MRKGRLLKVQHYYPDYTEIHLRIKEKFGSEFIEKKRAELCSNCTQLSDCRLLPIMIDGKDCPYFTLLLPHL